MTVHNRVVLAGKYANSIELRNVFYFRTVFTTINGSQADTLMHAIMSDSGLMSCLSDNIVYDTVYLSHWTGPADGIWWQETEPHRKPDPPWTMGELASITSMPGVQNLDDLGPVPSALITLYTTAKRVRGHKYFSGIPEGNQADGVLNAEFMISLDQAATVLDQPYTIGSDQATPELWGYRWGFNEVTAAVGRAVISTQRRRQYQRGV